MLRRGQAEAGSVVVIHRDRSGEQRALTRVMAQSGHYAWQVAAHGDSLESWLERQSRHDPDLWVIELDTPDPARFIDETTA